MGDFNESQFGPIALSSLEPRPVVSVIMANYNYGQFVSEAIESLIAQTWDRWELIVCDDGSTDNSRWILEDFARRDERITVICKQNAGQRSAWNEAYTQCNGEIICFLDSDDVFRPEKLEHVVSQFRKAPKAGILVHPLTVIDGFGTSVQDIPLVTRFDEGWIGQRFIERGGRWRDMPSSAICLRRQAAELVFPIPDPEFRYAADGYAITLLPLLTEVTSVNVPLALYRVHGANKLGALSQNVEDVQFELESLESQVNSVNAKLTRMHGPNVQLDLSRNLLYQQRHLLLALLRGDRRHQMVRRYAHLASLYRDDDMYSSSQKLLGLMVHAVAIAAPQAFRPRLLRVAFGYSPFRQRVRNVIRQSGLRIATLKSNLGSLLGRVCESREVPEVIARDDSGRESGRSDKPARVLFLTPVMMFSAGVPRSFLNVARHRDPERISMDVAWLHLSEPDYLQLFDDLNVPLHHLGSSYHGAIRTLRRLQASEAYEVIVVRSFKSYFIAKAATAGRACRVVFWLPGTQLIVHGLLRRLLFRVLSRNDPLIFISRYVESHHSFSSHNGASYVLYHGIDDPYEVEMYRLLPRAKARKDLGVPKDAFVFGYVAEIIPWKNHRTLIEAFTIIAREFPEAHLVMIGGGQRYDREVLERQIAAHPAADRIHLTGPRKHVRRLLSAIDVYVHPSIGEGFGQALAEAMLAGLPAAVANAGALPEIVDRGRAGILFDPDDPTDIATKLRMMIERPGLRKKLADAGRTYCLDAFPPERFIEDLTSIIDHEVRRVRDDMESPASGGLR